MNQYTKGERKALPYGNNTYYVETEDKEIATGFTNKYDALLDAAAPKLYEALKWSTKMLRAIIALHRDKFTNITVAEMELLIKENDEALAAVEGRE